MRTSSKSRFPSWRNRNGRSSHEGRPFSIRVGNPYVVTSISPPGGAGSAPYVKDTIWEVVGPLLLDSLRSSMPAMRLLSPGSSGDDDWISGRLDNIAGD